MTNLLDVLHKIMALRKESSCVNDKAGEISYGELDKLTNAFAAELCLFGVKKEDFVGIYVPRSRGIVVGMISVLKSGAAAMPIDAEYPVERISYMCRNADCRLILTEKVLWKEKPLPDFSGKVIFLDEAPKEATEEGLRAMEKAQKDVVPNQASLLLYTSGTTGQPKGVVHTHASLSAVAATFPSGEKPLDENCRVAVFAGFTFIAAILYLFAPLLAGGTIYIVPESLKSDMDGLYRYWKKNGITHTFLPPSLGILFAEKYDCQGIHLMFAGEKMRPFKPAYPIDVANAYGSTEGVIIATHYLNFEEQDIPLGKPFPGTKIKIIDEQGKEAKEGETGELLYSSPIQAREYLHLSELTKEKWVVIDGDRYFHTGDRVKMENGLLYYVGRGDDMVKIRGYRVELGEVENAIASCGGKNFACALRSIRGSDKLCCFYEKGKDFPLETLQKRIARTLASYMVPEVWEAIDSLPRNANGKVVRRDLPTPVLSQADYVAPRNDVDAMIVKTMEELLGMKRIGMNDSFVLLGGDSIRAMSLSSRLRQKGIILPSTDILQTGSVGELCQKAKVQYEKIWDEDEWEALQKDFASRGEAIEKVLPLSNDQEVMLLQHLLYADDPNQVSYCSFLCDVPLLESPLRKALDELSKRHESLRVAIIYQNVSAIQQAVVSRRFPLEVKEVSSKAEAAEATNRFYDENGPFTFDLQASSPLRFSAINLKEGTSLLLVAATRFLLDEPSLRVYLAELFALLSLEFPSSKELPAWEELLSLDEKEEDAKKSASIADGSYFARVLDRSFGKTQEKSPDPVFTYSKIPGAKSMIFVHTANTGSEAYYNLAKKISSRFSFAVLEQYNLYHPGKEIYGLKNLAKKYLEILKSYQPKGPYILGGWCYGGMLAYEMACLLEKSGEKVEQVILFDSQASTGKKMKALSKRNQSLVRRSYFETCPLFEDMRTKGMLEALITNYQHVAQDVVEYTPSRYHGKVLFFKPEVIPKGSIGAAYDYQMAMQAKKADGYEDFVDPDQLEIILTPHEHDLMMDEESLKIIVPRLLQEAKK